MAQVAANPEATLDPRPNDETLSAAALKSLSLFAELKRAPTFEKFPGALVLRRYSADEVIVRQGEPGWTAFYVLTRDDLIRLRKAQLHEIREEPAAQNPALDDKQSERQARWEQELKEPPSGASGPVDESRHLPVVTAQLDLELSSQARRPSFFSRLFRQRRVSAEERPEFIPNDGSVDIALSTRQAPIYEGELFGEMSCMSRIPRSATVVANRDCYLLEMLRNILDQIRRDPNFKEKTDRIYRERALGQQLRRFSIFARLSTDQFEKLRQRAELVNFSPGQLIHKEGDPSDAFYVIRNGMVKIVKSLPTPRTLTYLGRGDFFGEAGVMLNKPRTATSIACGHPQAEGVGSDVELVRIDRDVFLELCQSSHELQSLFHAQLQLYQRREREQGESRDWDANRPVFHNPRFEELGLIQGQKLMLVDLDRCTRCGDCMQACIDTHDDGVSRLYLDGPRFGKYLVPNACRKCLDPVCMIGCPVGSIVRGDDGQIIIKDWCIGCGLCADQCPYGSIHMHRLETLDLPIENARAKPATDGESAARDKDVDKRAVVCDLCAGLNGMGPACVYHCPHDAAIRVDARFEFPAG